MGAEKRSTPREESLPTPQRKRPRTEELREVPEDDDVVLIQDEETVPCEVCGARVPFENFVLHMSVHDGHEVENEDITCDVCGELVPFSLFAEHAEQHSSSASSRVTCEVCGVSIAAHELTDHLAAHKVHSEVLDAEMKSSTSEVDITAQVVEMARAGGAGLPGNRSVVSPGDAVLVRWSDGQWYPAHVASCRNASNGLKYDVNWDPPYARWAPEEALAQSVIPRMNQPREVCNFDVALEFVKKFQAARHRSSSHTTLEVVYHWTREENVQKIVENNLRPPGGTNADGTSVHVVNGEAYGRGIYASTDVNFGRSYGLGLTCGFLCLAFRGHVSGRSGRRQQRLGTNDDSFSSATLRVYRHSEQVLPLFFTDVTTAPRLAQCAQEIIQVLEQRALQQQPTSTKFQKGDQVDAEWSGLYFKARISKVRADGRYDLTWLFPYQSWPPEFAVAEHRLR